MAADSVREDHRHGTHPSPRARQSGPGHEPTNPRPSGSLDDHLLRRKVYLLRLATRTIRKCHIDEADLDAEGAVDLAFSQLCQTTVPWSDNATDGDIFVKVMTVAIRRVVRDRLRHALRRKRIGSIADLADKAAEAEARGPEVTPGTKLAPHRQEWDLDEFVSPEPPAEDVVAAKLEFEAFLQRLPDDLHRSVLILRHEGHSIPAMALLLNVTRRTVERKLKDNQQSYRQWKPDI